MLPKPTLDDAVFICGIDPGFRGAFCVMNIQGTHLQFWDMPMTTPAGGKDKQREIDLVGLDAIFTHLRLLPACLVGIEWPTTRPGEGAERSERFGRGKGYLEAFAYLKGLVYRKIAPNLWKPRLGLPGKTNVEANRMAFNLFQHFYPDATKSILGPRGGILDGRCEAALIAHYLRTRRVQGLQAVVDQYGKDSPQAMALVLSGGRRRKKPAILFDKT